MNPMDQKFPQRGILVISSKKIRKLFLEMKEWMILY
jgi:hypothetical protein